MIQTRPNELRPDEPAAGAPGTEPQDRLRQHGDDIKRQAGEVRQAAGEAVTQAGDKLREAGRQAKDQVVQTARQTTTQVRERASDVIASQKARLADEVSVFSEALHKAADTLDRHDDRMLGRYVHQAADCVDGCVNYLRERDASEMVRKVGDFTRRHPEVVLGGLFLAGVAAARFLKASDRPRMRNDLYRDDFDRDYGYMDTGRGLASDTYGYTDAGYGDVGMYAGEGASGVGARGMNDPFGAIGDATIDRSVTSDMGQLDDISRREDVDTIDEITGLAPMSRENRGQRGDADMVPDLPREDASLTRNTDIPAVTSPQPGSYPPVTQSGTFFESTSGQAGKANPTAADDDLSTIGRNDPSCPTNPKNPR